MAEDNRPIHIEGSQGILAGNTIDAGGDVIVNGQKVTNIFQNTAYQDLVKRKKELEELIRNLPAENAVCRKAGVELEELLNKEAQFKKDVIQLAESFSRINIDSERLAQAKALFSEGAFEEADRLLNKTVLKRDQEAVLLREQQLDSALEEVKRKKEQIADEYLIKAQLTLTQLENPNRFEEADQYFQESIHTSAAFDNIFGYAYFLDEQNQDYKAVDYYKQALEIYQRLALDNPQRYEPDVATTQNNLGIMYRNLNAYDRAEAAYLEALEIRKRLALDNPQRYEPDVAGTQNNLGLMYSGLNAYDRAEAAYLEALEIYQRLALDNPQRYNVYLANTLKNMGYLHQALLRQSFDWAYRSSGMEYTRQAEAALSFYSTDIPLVKSYGDSIAELATYFEKVTEEDLQVQAQINQVLPLEEQVKTETGPAQKAGKQVEVVSFLEKVWQQYPQNETIISRLSNACGGLSWRQLFNRRFAEAEQAARKGLDFDPSQEWINTNLALSLLFQGKYEEAEVLYLDYKDKPYGDSTYSKAFLEDLNALEEAGITHPDVGKVRALLNG
ncbi:MAG: tetratricopeptide repeat protein [Lewinellaceae bacterium]|nr:tetratricopeptide repeat protein [Lewinellaceae bacterium]